MIQKGDYIQTRLAERSNLDWVSLHRIYPFHSPSTHTHALFLRHYPKTHPHIRFSQPINTPTFSDLIPNHPVAACKQTLSGGNLFHRPFPKTIVIMDVQVTTQHRHFNKHNMIQHRCNREKVGFDHRSTSRSNKKEKLNE